MRQRSAVTSGLLSASRDTSRNGTGIRKLLSLPAVLTLFMLSMASGDTSEARYNKLGHRMVCMCVSEPASGMGPRGCKQILLECTHAYCDVSPRMRHELRAALEKSDNDDVILRSFVQFYGTEVLEKSSTAINKLTWVVALAVLTFAAIAFVRKWRSGPVVAATPAGLKDVDVHVLLDRVRRETENDDLR